MMRWLAFAASIAVAALAAALPAAAQVEKMPNLITVTGQGEVTVTPDLAVLNGGVTTTGKTGREASEANAKLMTAVMQSLKATGIADKDIQTSRLSLMPVYDSNPKINNERRIVGFRATNKVNIEIRNLDRISDVVDRMVVAGANDISDIRFTVTSPSKPLDEARAAAVADARRKAELYAQAANVKLGMPVSITEQGAAPPRPMIMMRQAEAASTPISVGDEVLRVTVNVSYELQR
ncbi:MAG: uncharacterized protein QOD94_2876 [Alphaproteobacteria bacterium]|jgi:uncharacterized protein YggE|nr:uncharacterized protein [Alphaproteobacteria bacterium]